MTARGGALGQLERIDLVDGIGLGVVDHEVVAVDFERHRRNAGGLDARPDVGAAANRPDLDRADAVEQRRNRS